MFGPLGRVTLLIKSHAIGAVATATIVAAVAGAGAGFAIAGRHVASTTGTQPPATIGTLSPTPGANGKGHKGKGGANAQQQAGAQAKQLVTLVAQKTSSTYDAVVAQLQSGQTLDAIAGGQDQAVKDSATQTMKAHLDASVSSGKMTTTQEAARMATFTQTLNTAMSTPGAQFLALLNGGSPMQPGGTIASPSPSPAV